MIILILFLLVAGISVYVAQNNLTPVTLHIGSAVLNGIPLFYVIIGSLLSGLVMAYGIQLIRSVFIAFAMHGKDAKIKKGKSDILELTKRIHQLELENERLKDPASSVPSDTNAL